jgi:hypothetical protein
MQLPAGLFFCHFDRSYCYLTSGFFVELADLILSHLQSLTNNNRVPPK